MISLTTFATNIKNGLNANKQGVLFDIHSDAGKFKEAVKTRLTKERYTNGLLTATGSTIVPTSAAVVATQSVSLEICVQLFNPDKDEETAALYRSILDNYFEAFSTQAITENGKTYAVSAVYSLASTGTVEMRPVVGPSLTFYVNIEYGYIENGLNSNDCKFYLDGKLIPYLSAKITKTPTPQSDTFSNTGGKGTSVNTSFLRSFDFQVVAQTDSDLETILLTAMLGDDLNTTHTLVVQLGEGQPTTYTVVFGLTDISLEGVNNAGHNISLIERAFNDGTV